MEAELDEFKSDLLESVRQMHRGEVGRMTAVGASTERVRSGAVLGSAVFALASHVMDDPRASRIQKSLAASVLADRDGTRRMSADAQVTAARVLSGKRYAGTTKVLAASVLAQSVGVRRARSQG